jgi:hypothetical protein
MGGKADNTVACLSGNSEKGTPTPPYAYQEPLFHPGISDKPQCINGLRITPVN